MQQMTNLKIGPLRGKKLILLHANIKGADQPVQLHSLPSSFHIQSLESRKGAKSGLQIKVCISLSGSMQNFSILASLL